MSLSFSVYLHPIINSRRLEEHGDGKGNKYEVDCESLDTTGHTSGSDTGSRHRS